MIGLQQGHSPRELLSTKDVQMYVVDALAAFWPIVNDNAEAGLQLLCENSREQRMRPEFR